MDTRGLSQAKIPHSRSKEHSIDHREGKRGRAATKLEPKRPHCGSRDSYQVSGPLESAAGSCVDTMGGSEGDIHERSISGPVSPKRSAAGTPSGRGNSPLASPDLEKGVLELFPVPNSSGCRKNDITTFEELTILGAGKSGCAPASSTGGW